MANVAELTRKASKRTGHRTQLVGPVVEIIVANHRSGWSEKKIVEWLQHHIGPDNPAAQPGFVRWVLAEAGRA